MTAYKQRQMMCSKLNFISVLVLITGLSVGCRDANKTEKIGRDVFDVLTNLSVMDKTEYSSYFLSIEEINRLGEDEKVVRDARTRAEMKAERRDRYSKRITGDYKALKDNGIKLGIVWNDIDYMDFIYEEEEDLSRYDSLTGDVYFRYDNKVYKVEVFAIFNGSRYRLASFSGPYEL